MIVIKKSKNGQFYFIVKAINGQILATSETYTRKSNCLKGAAALQWIIINDRDVKIKDDSK